MFTYGSSNCTYDNLFQPHGKEDTFNKIARNYIIVEGNIGKTIENACYYFTHQDEWNKLFSEISSKVPKPPARAITASDNSSIFAFLSLMPSVK